MATPSPGHGAGPACPQASASATGGPRRTQGSLAPTFKVLRAPLGGWPVSEITLTGQSPQSIGELTQGKKPAHRGRLHVRMSV